MYIKGLECVTFNTYRNSTRMFPNQVTYLKGSSIESFTLGPTPKIDFSSTHQQHLATASKRTIQHNNP
jgi:hypothetical protein